MDEVDYQRIREVEFLCRQTAVCFELNFSEPDGTYYYVINSPAKEEGWLGRSRSFNTPQQIT